MSFLNLLIRRIRKRYPKDVPIEILERSCRWYQVYYHHRVEPQTEMFYGSWGWVDARRREFREALDASIAKQIQN
jgi:hypothetical protein